MCAWVLQDDSIHKLCLSIMEDTNRPRFILVVYRKIWGVKPKLFIFLILKHNRCLFIYYCSLQSLVVMTFRRRMCTLVQDSLLCSLYWSLIDIFSKAFYSDGSSVSIRTIWRGVAEDRQSARGWSWSWSWSDHQDGVLMMIMVIISIWSWTEWETIKMECW